MVSKKQKTMSSRESILNAVRQNKPEEVLLEAVSFAPASAQDLIALFKTSLENIGGRCVIADHPMVLNDFLQEAKRNGRLINGIENTEDYNLDMIQGCEAKELETVDTAVIKGVLGVAENGAVWVKEKDLGHRILPFICQQLVLVVEESALVATLHDAYDRLTIQEDGYGLYIAGPSKTADIEQSLVIGAHGPVTMQVFILKN